MKDKTKEELIELIKEARKELSCRNKTAEAVTVIMKINDKVVCNCFIDEHKDNILEEGKLYKVGVEVGFCVSENSNLKRIHKSINFIPEPSIEELFNGSN